MEAAPLRLAEIPGLRENDARVDERRDVVGVLLQRGGPSGERFLIPPLPGEVVSEVVVEVRGVRARPDHLAEQTLRHLGTSRALGGEGAALLADHGGRHVVHRVDQRIADHEVVVETAGAFRRGLRLSAGTRPPVDAGQRGGDGAGLRSEALRLLQERQRLFEVSVAREQASEPETRGRGVGRRGAGSAQPLKSRSVVVLCGLGIRAVLGDLSGEQVGGNVGGIQADRIEHSGFGQLGVRAPQGPGLQVRKPVVVRGQRARGGVRGGRLRMEFVSQERGAERRPAVRGFAVVEDFGTGLPDHLGDFRLHPGEVGVRRVGKVRAASPEDEEGRDQDRGRGPEPEGPGRAPTPLGRRFRRGPVAARWSARGSPGLVGLPRNPAGLLPPPLPGLPGASHCLQRDSPAPRRRLAVSAPVAGKTSRAPSGHTTTNSLTWAPAGTAKKARGSPVAR